MYRSDRARIHIREHIRYKITVLHPRINVIDTDTCKTVNSVFTRIVNIYTWISIKINDHILSERFSVICIQYRNDNSVTGVCKRSDSKLSWLAGFKPWYDLRIDPAASKLGIRVPVSLTCVLHVISSNSINAAVGHIIIIDNTKAVTELVDKSIVAEMHRIHAYHVIESGFFSSTRVLASVSSSVLECASERYDHESVLICHITGI